MTPIEPTDQSHLDWVAELLVSGPILIPTVAGAAPGLDGITIEGVDRLVIQALDGSKPGMGRATILTLDTGGTLTAAILHEAAWSATVLAILATVAAGRADPSDHRPEDGLAGIAAAKVAAIGAVATPIDTMPIDDNTFLDGVALTYDPATRTLTGLPILGD